MLSSESSQPEAKNRPASLAKSSAKSLAKYRRFQTALAECKDAVAQVREWLESGAEPREIAIVAPDIEVVWPMLAMHFDVEGIPVKKSRVARLHSFLTVQGWLSQLKLRVGVLTEDEVETSFLSLRDKIDREFTSEKFRGLFGMIFGENDIAQIPKVGEALKQLFSKGEVSSKLLNRKDFLAWSLLSLPESIDLAHITAVCRQVFADCPPATCLSFSRWVSLLEIFSSKRNGASSARGS
jgi:hypothetical protein